MTVAGFIVESFRESGIDTVFGLPGVHALGLWNALEQSSVRYIGFRHEHSAAHAADGYGRASGKPGALFVSTGPGMLNALSPIGEAMVSRSPMFVVTSTIASRYVGRDKGQLHEGKDLMPAYEAVSKWAARAEQPHDIPKLFEEGLRTAIGSRPGPVILEIPADFFDTDIDAEPVRPRSATPKLDPSVIAEAVHLLGLAARPVIWAGGGVIRSGASASLTALAEKLDAPVITTFMGKGAIAEDHPLSVGTMVRQPEAARLLAESDVLLAVGTRFSGMATGNWKLQMPSQLIHIDIDPDELGRNYPVRLGIHADADEALSAIFRPIDRSGAARDGRAAAASVRGAAFDRTRQHGSRELEMLQAIRRASPPETVMVQDMTIPSYWAAPFLEITEPGSFITPYGYGSLGFSLPASIGVAAAGRAPVVSFNGDGGIQYHLGELTTIAENNLPITILVFNDRSWGVLKAFSRSRYESDLGMSLSGPDFIAVAAACGIPGRRAEDPSELYDAVRDGIESAGPSLVEVPGDWVVPPPAEYYR